MELAAAKEAANMVDLDSDPSNILKVVKLGKQLLMTRGAITTFSIANDAAKYFAILPAMFMENNPTIAALNIMQLHNPQTAILSTLIFNAIVIPALIPISLKGIRIQSRIITKNICKKYSCLWNRWSSIAFCWNQGNRCSAISFYLIMEVIEENK